MFLLEESATLFGIRNELIVAGILGGFVILACISAYAAQRWAHRSFLELKQMNERLEAMQREQNGIAPSERPSSYLDDES